MSLLKRLFGIRKANKSTGDTQVDFEVKDLKKGFILDYDLKSWEVQDVAVYEWDNGVKDYEYTIFDGKEKQFLNYESASGNISVYWKSQINEIWGDFRAMIRKGEDITNETFTVGGSEFYFAGEGAARVKSMTETFHMTNWLFQSDDNRYISFNKYEDGFLEAYEGIGLSPHAVSNILPR